MKAVKVVKYVKYLLMMFVGITIGVQIVKTISPVNATGLPEGRSVIVCHAAVRCPTCTTMERLTRACLEQSFPNDGILFRTLNYQASENEEIAERYKIATATVLLVDKHGESERVENLSAQAWLLIGDEPAFMEMVRTRLEAFLRGDTGKSDASPEGQTIEGQTIEGTPVDQNLNWE